MSSFFYPTPNADLKSAALTTFGASGILDPVFFNLDAWVFNGSALTDTSISGTASASVSGIYAGSSDGSGGAWLVQQSGPLIHITSGGTSTAAALPSGHAWRGVAYVSGFAAPYTVNEAGSIYTVSGASGIVAGQFGATPLGLRTSGSTLFTLLPSVPALGFFTLSSLATGSSGQSASPITTPSCLAATSGHVAIAGWNSLSIASGFSSLSPNPGVTAVMAGANPATHSISLIASGASGWAVTQTVTGLAGVAFVDWVPNGQQVLGCDPVSGKVYVLNYTFGALALSQTLTVSGATQVATTTDSAHALVTQAALNLATPLTSTLGTWASGSAIVIGNPQAAIGTGPSGIAIGCSSGVALLALSGSVWSVSSTGAVGFVPTAMALDSVSSLYAAGTSGASGHVAMLVSGSIAVTASAAWAGAASGIVVVQNQITVADPSVPELRIFGYVSGSSLTAYATGVAPAGVSVLAFFNPDLLAAASGVTYQYRYGAPYQVNRAKTGAVSIYTAGSFTTLSLGYGVTPETVTWDASGNITLASLENTLYSISSGAVLLGTSGIAQATGQPSTTPIGTSHLLWASGHLYAASSLCDALIEIA